MGQVNVKPETQVEEDQKQSLVGQNRMRLIGLEGQYREQVQSGELTNADDLDWGY